MHYIRVFPSKTYNFSGQKNIPSELNKKKQPQTHQSTSGTEAHVQIQRIALSGSIYPQCMPICTSAYLYIVMHWYANILSIKSYPTKSQRDLTPNQDASHVVQSPQPIYQHRKACLSEQPPWCAAGDSRLEHSRSRVQAQVPTGVLRAIFFSTLPFFPTTPVGSLGLDKHI